MLKLGQSAAQSRAYKWVQKEISPSPASEASEGPIAGRDARIKKKPGRH